MIFNLVDAKTKNQYCKLITGQNQFLLKSKLIQALIYSKSHFPWHTKAKSFGQFQSLASIIDLLNMFKLVSTICAAHHRFEPSRLPDSHQQVCLGPIFPPPQKFSVLQFGLEKR